MVYNLPNPPDHQVQEGAKAEEQKICQYLHSCRFPFPLQALFLLHPALGCLPIIRREDSALDAALTKYIIKYTNAQLPCCMNSSFGFRITTAQGSHGNTGFQPNPSQVCPWLCPRQLGLSLVNELKLQRIKPARAHSLQGRHMPGQAKHAARDSAKAAWPLGLIPRGLGGLSGL